MRCNPLVNAGELYVGDVVINADGDTYPIQNIDREIVDEPVTVYKFQVEDFHTYYVGNLGVLVHNADYAPSEKYLNRTEKNGDRVYNREVSGKEVEVKYTKSHDGNYYLDLKNIHTQITRAL